jgi:hypothetical protein
MPDIPTYGYTMYRIGSWHRPRLSTPGTCGSWCGWCTWAIRRSRSCSGRRSTVRTGCLRPCHAPLRRRTLQLLVLDEAPLLPSSPRRRAATASLLHGVDVEKLVFWATQNGLPGFAAVPTDDGRNSTHPSLHPTVDTGHGRKKAKVERACGLLHCVMTADTIARYSRWYFHVPIGWRWEGFLGLCSLYSATRLCKIRDWMIDALLLFYIVQFIVFAVLAHEKLHILPPSQFSSLLRIPISLIWLI